MTSHLVIIGVAFAVAVGSAGVSLTAQGASAPRDFDAEIRLEQQRDVVR